VICNLSILLLKFADTGDVFEDARQMIDTVDWVHAITSPKPIAPWCARGF